MHMFFKPTPKTDNIITMKTVATKVKVFQHTPVFGTKKCLTITFLHRFHFEHMYCTKTFFKELGEGQYTRYLHSRTARGGTPAARKLKAKEQIGNALLHFVRVRQAPRHAQGGCASSACGDLKCFRMFHLLEAGWSEGSPIRFLQGASGACAP